MSIQKTNNNNRQRGSAFEKKVAEFLGFFRVPLSGSAEIFGLGDVRDVESQEDSLTIGECKSITPRSAREINYTVKEEWLIGKNGIVGKAKKKNKMPWLALTKVRSSMWYVILMPQHFRMFLRSIDILKAQGQISQTRDIDKLEQEINEIWGNHGYEDNA
ncbi:hypothetical protein BpsS140_00052 [Bacillus phage vB_BpsS-140]|nr:hypothetical protein BpsS140_00052 [Bacillus phage vB_BpsS-140]